MALDAYAGFIGLRSAVFELNTDSNLVRAGAYGGVISRREQVLAHMRKGKGGRTHLVSPQMAAAAAIKGRFVDIRNWH